MNLHEKRIIGGLVRGVVRPSELDLAPSDFEDADIGACLIHARQIEKDGHQIDPHLLTSRMSDQGFYTADDFILMASAVGSASVVWESVDR